MKRTVRKIEFSILRILIAAIMMGGCAVNVWSEQIEKGKSVGEQFYRETSLSWSGVMGGLLKSKPSKPPLYKTYTGAKMVKLPEPTYRGATVEEAVRKRRSHRNYSKQPLKLEQLSQLLFAAQGLTGKMYGEPLRSTPSAGALYPMEVYVVVNNIEGISRGIYHYNVRQHALELIKEGDFRRQITDAGLEQEMLGKAGATFVLSAIFDRARYKYGDRAFRYVYIEAGHISQNIYLQAESLGLGSVCVGAFFDEKVNGLIGVDGEKEAVVYLHAVGTQ